jgi:outer membrane receptor protein involved in Fe transport
MGQEVVVSATRSAQRILDAPVTVERMSSATIRNVPAPSYYEAINNLKGVDMHTASLTFRTITTRGFMSSGNLRLNQLIDGMDNQAPGLNFAVGSVIGLTELDVDNIELLSGASSALYGSGGMNGTLLINSKNPFRFQGFSYQVKQGIMHLGSPSGQSPSPFYDWSMRYAKAIGERFAFKLTGQFIRATDWQAYDERNVSRTNVLSKVKDGDRITDPNYDGINVYGDETSANIFDLIRLMYQFSGMPALTSNVPGQPFTWGYALQNTANQNVSRTGYKERDLVDYNTLNFKFTGGLHYKITPGIEASWNSYFGTGTTVYTGIDRYSLKNLKIAQHKLEVRGSTWFVRGYTTQENAGDSYANTVLGRVLNETWKPSFNAANAAGSWYPQYIFGYLNYKFAAQQSTGNPGAEFGAHQFARGIADVGRLKPGTPQFNTATDAIKSRAIPSGAQFLDRSDLYAAEAQLNVSDQLGFSRTVEVIAGGQFKQYVLNSQGTIFADTTGALKPAEYGGYMQFKKRFLDDRLTITAAGRYDGHTNFDGRFTPRLTAVLRVSKDNNIRVSYQTAYRFPTNQDQYINLNSGAAFLIGHIPEFQDFYNVPENPTYTAESIVAARTALNPSLLVRAPYEKVKPESVTSYELGYKGIVASNLFIDGYVYYSKFTDFLGRIAVGQSAFVSYGNAPPQGTASPAHVLNPLTTRNLSYIQNTNVNVKAIGWGVTAEYRLPRNYFIYGNIFSDELRDVPEGVVTSFNAPLYRFNLGLRNDRVFKNIGFNLVYRWQDENDYEGTFATGTLPSFGWLDGQVSYKIPNSKSQIRVGGTNILNNYQRTGLGSPSVGGLYYVSFAYNVN